MDFRTMAWRLHIPEGVKLLSTEKAGCVRISRIENAGFAELKHRLECANPFGNRGLSGWGELLKGNGPNRIGVK